MAKKTELEEIKHELKTARREAGRLADLLWTASALLAAAGQADASWEIWKMYSPDERKDDWKVLVALEVGRWRSGHE